MSIINKLNIQKFHASRIEKFGEDTVRSMGWHTKDSQLRRFEVMSRVGDLNDISILDVGCGNGDFCVYLQQHFSRFRYSGIDFMEVFLDEAVEQNKHYPFAKFYSGDFMTTDLPTADYVFASGSLNYKNTDPDFIFKAIEKLYASCKKAFCFNLLSETLNPDGILATYPPDAIRKYCATLSPEVSLVDDYEPGDFTVVMYNR